MRDNFPSNSIDGIVCDPPYGLKFMGKGWDYGIPGIPYWTEILRVAKPGAYLLAFGGTRKYHRLACAIEDAGFEIRDCLMWVYGSGFPKSMDISKAIKKDIEDQLRTQGVIGEIQWK
jgi:site-specific DNA-methyltransferase (adenine-specific)